jgi:hypothetical protein
VCVLKKRNKGIGHKKYSMVIVCMHLSEIKEKKNPLKRSPFFRRFRIRSSVSAALFEADDTAVGAKKLDVVKPMLERPSVCPNSLCPNVCPNPFCPNYGHLNLVLISFVAIGYYVHTK